MESVYQLFNHFLTNDKYGNKCKLHSMSVFLVMMQSLGLSSEFIYEELSIRHFKCIRSISHVESFARTDTPTDVQSWNKWITGIDNNIVLSKKGYICFGELFGIPEKVCIWEFEARQRSRLFIKPINDCLSEPTTMAPTMAPTTTKTGSSISLPHLVPSLLPSLRKDHESPQDERNEYLRKN